MMVGRNSARTRHTRLRIRSTWLEKRAIWALGIGGRRLRAGGATTSRMIVLGPVASTPIAPCGAGTITPTKDRRSDLTCRQPHTATATLAMASMMWQQCTASPAWVGGARSLPHHAKPYPSRPAVPAGQGTEASGFDDSSWREVATPHDFVIEGKPCFPALGCDNAHQNSNAMHGSYPKGVGWYVGRKSPLATKNLLEVALCFLLTCSSSDDVIAF